MKELRYTLLSDGSSDDALLPILTWLLRENGVQSAIQPIWAELRQLRRRPPKILSEKIKRSLELYPCDLLFVHRDAESEPREQRIFEINEAIEKAASEMMVPPTICVVPVRMQETWLLFDAKALRRAAGNPNGKHQLQLPRIAELEKLRDPKDDLHGLIREASGLKGRRRKRFHVHKNVRRVAELIQDFSPLRELPAFTALEADIQQTISMQGWGTKP
ncbi:DUF4276 family protein [candidate division KSB1 bacterium]|nr:DUF4276 family protein [candidate division KSB1 bacterium]